MAIYSNDISIVSLISIAFVHAITYNYPIIKIYIMGVKYGIWAERSNHKNQ